MTTCKINFNDLQVIHICKPRLKNTYISIDRSGSITLKSPEVSKQFIDALLKEKETWIRKQLKISQENKAIKINLEDELLLFGDLYSIDVDEATALRESLSMLRVNSEKNILRCYDNFYKEYADRYITDRVEQFAQVMKQEFKAIQYKKLKSRWGSCTSNKILTFNTQLIKIDKRLIDYVIVHELAHLTHMNHSKKFHDLVDMYIDDSKELRKELKAIHLL